MKRYLILFLLITAVFGCRKGQESTDDEQSDKIIITRSSSEYSDASLNRSSEKSDPFDLKSIILNGDSVEITVAYPGGCRFHSFEIIWNETFSDTEPPQTGLIILHDANGDMCEAYITDTLTFCVCDLTDDLSLDTVYVNVLNGWTPVDSTSSGGWYPADTASYNDGDYGVVFPESDSCLVKVIASQVICGTGLYNNLWFALEDSISAGMEGYYFRKYLQPIAIDESLAGFVPVQGKKYIVGARIEKDHNYLNVPVCLAYSGPSVPVKIICIKEIN